MPLSSRKQADELFQKILFFYKDGNYSEAIHLIEQERDLLGENLNMGDQQKLNKLYSSCAYEEIKRLYEAKRHTSQLKKMLELYSPMLEVHLSDDKRESFSKILKKYGSSEYNNTPSGKRLHNINSPNFQAPGENITFKLIRILLIFIFVLGIIFTVLPLVREKLQNKPESEKPSMIVEPNVTGTNETQPPIENTVPIEPEVENTTESAAVIVTPENQIAKTATPVNQTAETATPEVKDEYFLPSDTKILTKENIQHLSKKEVKLAINELFARKGYDFGGSGQYYDYFSQKSWYQPDPSIKSPVEAEAKFSDIERKNLQLLVKQRNNL